MIRFIDFGIMLILVGTVIMSLNSLAVSNGGGSSKVQLFGMFIFAIGGFFIISRLLSYIFPILSIGLILFVAYRLFLR